MTPAKKAMSSKKPAKATTVRKAAKKATGATRRSSSSTPTPQPDGDYLELYADAAGEHRWRRRDGANHKIVAESGEGYDEAGYAADAATTYNRDSSGAPLPIRD